MRIYVTAKSVYIPMIFITVNNFVAERQFSQYFEMDNESVLLFYYLLTCFSGVPAGVREDASRRCSPSRHHETHHLHPVLDESETRTETLPQDAQLSDTYTGRNIAL